MVLGISEPFRLRKIQDSLPTTWGHFCVWPSEPPMNFVDLFHARELIYVLDILRHFNCQTLPDCSFISTYLDSSAGLIACLSVNWRQHARTLQTFSRHCKFSFWGSVLCCLTSVLSISEKMDWQHKVKYSNLSKVMFCWLGSLWY